MGRVIESILLILTMDFYIAGSPINVGLNVKIKPINMKDEFHPKTFGTLFAKIPQDMTPESSLRRQLLGNVVAKAPDICNGCSNQIARKIFPNDQDLYYVIDQSTRSPIKFMDSPSDPSGRPNKETLSKGYKVLVAAAPPNVMNNVDGEVLVYIIFPPESNIGEVKSNGSLLPQVYFVNKGPRANPLSSVRAMKPPDDLIIVNQNRTVTGIKSRHVTKFLTFRNKLLNRYGYSVVS